MSEIATAPRGSVRAPEGGFTRLIDGVPPTLTVALLGEAVAVWIFSLEGSESELERARRLLPEDELAHVKRVLDERRRCRLLLARAALRAILAAELGCEPLSVPLVRLPDGRPTLGGETRRAFSLSHTSRWAAVAIGPLARIGIDIETVDRLVADSVIERVLSVEEARVLRGLHPVERQRRFIDFWTVKEACAKVLDGGLARNLARLGVRDSLSRAPALLDPELADIEIHRLTLAAPLTGALAGTLSKRSRVH